MGFVRERGWASCPNHGQPRAAEHLQSWAFLRSNIRGLMLKKNGRGREQTSKRISIQSLNI